MRNLSELCLNDFFYPAIVIKVKKNPDDVFQGYQTSKKNKKTEFPGFYTRGKRKRAPGWLLLVKEPLGF